MSEFAGLAAAVRELTAVVSRRRRPLDDEGEPTPEHVTFVRDAPALADLQAHHELPRVYAEFLRAYSSHDFVDTGLVCGGVAAWIAPVDHVADLVACYADSGFPANWLVCATDYEGCYVLDLGRAAAGDCPVLFLEHGGGLRPREVAPSFVEFLRRVARDSSGEQVPSDMAQGTDITGAPRGREAGGSSARLAWTVLGAALALLLLYLVSL